ncbi:DUF1190 domain-containing protein [Rhodovarius crocodyli]|uniref:DUF1190 domain-containing protein n=1 Tax=Rhodovarius crocodyli TaxID=1979269 RepID=A0A437MD39_9PROT|nr:DUF1190 domain-containing protein [Rhodovarius crocodyli]RVT95567.1 DUF1190 domain-containing protein [Rhodovarius crocodyli]
MRRSTAVTITLLSTAAIALVWCGDGPTPPEGDTLFTSEDACRASFGSDDTAACRDAFADARQRHEATAPRFTERAICENQTGGECTTVSQPNGTSLFIPVMAGVLIGRVLASGGPRSVMPLYAGAQANCPPGIQPLPPGCAAPRPTSSSTSGGRGFYYSGSSYMGDSDRTGATRSFNASTTGSTVLARGGSYSGSSSIARGGLGSTGRGFSSSSSSS